MYTVKKEQQSDRSKARIRTVEKKMQAGLKR